MGKRGPTPGGKMAAVPTKLPERPRPPAGMTPRARAKWRAVVNGYPVEHFKAGDLPLLRAYCEAHDKAVRMQERIDQDGDFINAAAGTLKAHPAHAVKLAAESLMAQLATKLRLCANSRIDKHKAGREKVEVSQTQGRKMFGGAGV